jgi:uncharacterized membrane protein
MNQNSFALAARQGPVGLTCPNCKSDQIATKDYGRKTGSAVGAATGAVSGAVGAVGGAELGAAAGMMAGPIGAFFGGIAGGTYRRARWRGSRRCGGRDTRRSCR